MDIADDDENASTRGACAVRRLNALKPGRTHVVVEFDGRSAELEIVRHHSSCVVVLCSFCVVCYYRLISLRIRRCVWRRQCRRQRILWYYHWALVLHWCLKVDRTAGRQPFVIIRTTSVFDLGGANIIIIIE